MKMFSRRNKYFSGYPLLSGDMHIGVVIKFNLTLLCLLFHAMKYHAAKICKFSKKTTFQFLSMKASVVLNYTWDKRCKTTHLPHWISGSPEKKRENLGVVWCGKVSCTLRHQGCQQILAYSGPCSR